VFLREWQTIKLSCIKLHKIPVGFRLIDGQHHISLVEHFFSWSNNPPINHSPVGLSESPQLFELHFHHISGKTQILSLTKLICGFLGWLN
jgi:hypothetical protein